MQIAQLVRRIVLRGWFRFDVPVFVYLIIGRTDIDRSLVVEKDAICTRGWGSSRGRCDMWGVRADVDRGRKERGKGRGCPAREPG